MSTAMMFSYMVAYAARPLRDITLAELQAGLEPFPSRPYPYQMYNKCFILYSESNEQYNLYLHAKTGDITLLSNDLYLDNFYFNVDDTDIVYWYRKTGLSGEWTLFNVISGQSGQVPIRPAEDTSATAKLVYTSNNLVTPAGTMYSAGWQVNGRPLDMPPKTMDEIFIVKEGYIDGGYYVSSTTGTIGLSRSVKDITLSTYYALNKYIINGSLSYWRNNDVDKYRHDYNRLQIIYSYVDIKLDGILFVKGGRWYSFKDNYKYLANEYLNHMVTYDKQNKVLPKSSYSIVEDVIKYVLENYGDGENYPYYLYSDNKIILSETPIEIIDKGYRNEMPYYVVQLKRGDLIVPFIESGNSIWVECFLLADREADTHTIAFDRGLGSVQNRQSIYFNGTCAKGAYFLDQDLPIIDFQRWGLYEDIWSNYNIANGGTGEVPIPPEPSPDPEPSGSSPSPVGDNPFPSYPSPNYNQDGDIGDIDGGMDEYIGNMEGAIDGIDFNPDLSDFRPSLSFISGIINDIINQLGSFKVVIFMPLIIGIALMLIGRGTRVRSEYGVMKSQRGNGKKGG